MSQKKVTYIKLLHQLRKKIARKQLPGKVAVEKEQFEILLSGVTSVLNGYQLAELEIGEGIDRSYLKQHLKEQFQIEDTASAIEAIKGFLNENTQWQYEQFLGFWSDQPPFDVKDLDGESQYFLNGCMAFAKQFYPFVTEKGFAAFDFGECVRMARECYAVGFLEEDMTKTMIADIGARAFRTFDSWEEFAISYLCGGTYFIYRSTDQNNEQAAMMFQTILQAIEKLFFAPHMNVWNLYAWLEGKKYFPHMKETKQLIESTLGCFVTDCVSIEERPIGYMVKEEPSANYPDSGWRIFAGDETQEYIDDMDHTQVFSLNTLCNYDPDILPFLEEPIGTVIVRDREGKLVKEEKETTEA